MVFSTRQLRGGGGEVQERERERMSVGVQLENQTACLEKVQKSVKLTIVFISVYEADWPCE